MKILKRNLFKPILIALFILSLLIIALFIKNFSIPKDCKDLAKEFSNKYFQDEKLVLAIMKAESNFNKNATSNKNACGLMQIVPKTFEFVTERYGLNCQDIFNSKDNIEVGCCYLQYLFEKFNDETLVLCAYNAGEGVVRSWLKDEKYSKDRKNLDIIPYKETRDYVNKVKIYKKIYEGLF